MGIVREEFYATLEKVYTPNFMRVNKNGEMRMITLYGIRYDEKNTSKVNEALALLREYEGKPVKVEMMSNITAHVYITKPVVGSVSVGDILAFRNLAGYGGNNEIAIN